MMRAEGYYWVRARLGEWIVAEWDGRWRWWQCGDLVPREDDDYLTIGERIVRESA